MAELSFYSLYITALELIMYQNSTNLELWEYLENKIICKVETAVISIEEVYLENVICSN